MENEEKETTVIPMENDIIVIAKEEKDAAKHRVHLTTFVGCSLLITIVIMLTAFQHYVTWVIGIPFLMIIVLIYYRMLQASDQFIVTSTRTKWVTLSITKKEIILSKYAALTIDQLIAKANSAIEQVRQSRTHWIIALTISCVASIPMLWMEQNPVTTTIVIILVISVVITMLGCFYKDDWLNKERTYWTHVFQTVKHNRASTAKNEEKEG